MDEELHESPEVTRTNGNGKSEEAPPAILVTVSPRDGEGKREIEIAYLNGFDQLAAPTVLEHAYLTARKQVGLP